MSNLHDQAHADFRAFCDRCARIVATWPAWKRDVLGTFRDGPLRWYWVEVFERLDGPPLAGVWVLAGTRADAWHEVFREMPTDRLWDATADAELSAGDRTVAGVPPGAGNRSPVFDLCPPCVIVDCRGASPPDTTRAGDTR